MLEEELIPSKKKKERFKHSPPHRRELRKEKNRSSRPGIGQKKRKRRIRKRRED